jgi:ATP-dependent DNA helicase RecQ
LKGITDQLPPNTRLLATTATANKRVVDDLRSVLGPNLRISMGDLHRPSLTLQTIHLPSQAERMAWLAEQIPRLEGSGIVYCLTVRDTERVASWLRACDIDAEAYSAALDGTQEELEHSLLKNRIKALVATTALGMGFDKPDLGFVIHFQSPGSVVAYYQQVGRAGRALPSAYGVLLSGDEEDDINDYFISSAFPTRQEVGLVLEALESEPNGLSVPSLLQQLNIAKGRIDKALLLLSLETPSPVSKIGNRWQLAPVKLSDEFWQRAERLTDLRIEEQGAMQEYVQLTQGHMEYLIDALDGDPSGIGPPLLPPLPGTAPEATTRRAIEFLKRTEIPIHPRLVWPSGGLPVYQVSGRIPKELQLEEGRALCYWGDAGWGRLVSQGKYKLGHFDDDLVAAAAELIRRWSPEPRPAWVTAIPSIQHPDLVPGFAQRLAQAMALPYVESLNKTDDRPAQKTMVNSSQQARNVDGSLVVDMRNDITSGPVLLIDDLVDSRWTMTVVGWLLRSHGCGHVFPFALAMAGRES